MKNQNENSGRAQAVRNLYNKGIAKEIALKRLTNRFDITPSLLNRIWARVSKS